MVASAIQRVEELFEMGFLDDKDLETLVDLLEKKRINLNKVINQGDNAYWILTKRPYRKS